MAIKIINSSYSLPISLELIKKHLRIIEADDDETLQSLYIPAAAEVFTSLTHLQLITATVEQVFDAFPVQKYFLLERHPLQSFSKIEYLNSELSWEELDTEVYHVSDTLPTSINLLADKWAEDIHPTARGCVKITYDCGLGDFEENIPYDIKQALSMIVGDMFLHREDSITIPGIALTNPSWHSRSLLNKYKINFFQHASQERR